MPTDTERHEVAARLRELRSGWSSGECYYTIIHALGLPDTSREDGGAALYAILADLIEPDIYPDNPDKTRQGLSEPCDRDIPQKVAEEIFGKMRHSTKEEADAYDAMLKSKSVEIHPVDRDALLELVRMFERDAFIWVQFPLDESTANETLYTRNNVMSHIRRIREALGEVR